MAAIGTDNPTLFDVARAKDSKGRLTRIVNLMKQRSSIVEDAVWLPANGNMKHTVTSVVGLPSPVWGRINKGIATTKHKEAQYEETMGMMEDASEIDARIKRIEGPNFAAYRARADDNKQLAMVQTLETAVIYQTTVAQPEAINGLAPRYDVTTQPSGGAQIIKADSGASGSDQTSAWYVKWAEDACHMIYPEDGNMGIETKDMGEVELEDAAGAKYPGYKTYFNWIAGLVVEDYRQVVRVCNIDTGALSPSGTNIVEALVRGYHRIQNPEGGRLRLYMNRTLMTFLHLQARKEGIANPVLTTVIEGRPVMTFMGVPIRLTDSILDTEAVVS
jgi:hypothetical protein